jgi:hypothetical protein
MVSRDRSNVCSWHKIPVFISGEKSPMLGAIQTFWRKRSAFGGIPDMVRCPSKR